MLGHGEDDGHRTERLAAEVPGEAGDDDLTIEGVGDVADGTGEMGIEELGFVNTDNDLAFGMGVDESGGEVDELL